MRTVFRRKCEEHEMTSGWSQKGLNFNLRVNENRLQSIHFICMNNDFASHEKALPTDPDCLPLIRKGLIRHVMQAWAISYEEKDILAQKVFKGL